MPGAGTVIKVALQEEPPFQGITKSVNEQVGKVKAGFDTVTSSVDSVTSKVSGLFGGGSDEKAKLPKVEQLKGDKAEKKALAVSSPAKVESKPIEKPPIKPVALVKPKEEPLPREVVELEKTIELSAQLAVKEYHHAISVLKR